MEEEPNPDPETRNHHRSVDHRRLPNPSLLNTRSLPDSLNPSGDISGDLSLPYASLHLSDPCRLLQIQSLPETRLDFFHKLGYSTAQVRAVQKKFGPDVDTDKVLGELVRVRASREHLRTEVSWEQRGFSVSPGLMEVKGEKEERDELRAVVIDGSNVAMSHGNKEFFSCRGIQLCVDFFLRRGHDDVTVFVPLWRKEQPRPDVPIADQHLLRELEKRKILVFTPSRRVAGRRVVCDDDRFVVRHAFESDGVVVSNDMYRDLQAARPEWRRFIQNRLLMFTFINDKFMPPDDPLGRHGPDLDDFLRKFPKAQKKQSCPYGRKCTFGTKCKFLHAELQDGQQGARSTKPGRKSELPRRPALDSGLGSMDSRSLPGPAESTRSEESRAAVRKKLRAIFSAQLVDRVMERFPDQLDPQTLVGEILKLQSQQ